MHFGLGFYALMVVANAVRRSVYDHPTHGPYLFTSTSVRVLFPALTRCPPHRPQVQVYRTRAWKPLPIANVPFVAGPVMFLYNLDMVSQPTLVPSPLPPPSPRNQVPPQKRRYPQAYGDKMERLNVETQTILRTEAHWFNGPIALPSS